MKLHKHDEVKIVIGKDKGKTGKIEKVLPKENKVVVTGLNEYKRHKKARFQGETSGIVTITVPLSVAKVQIICPKCKQLTRIGYITENDKKVRICKKCKQVI